MEARLRKFNYASRVEVFFEIEADEQLFLTMEALQAETGKGGDA